MEKTTIKKLSKTIAKKFNVEVEVKEYYASYSLELSEDVNEEELFDTLKDIKGVFIENPAFVTLYK